MLVAVGLVVADVVALTFQIGDRSTKGAASLIVPGLVTGLALGVATLMISGISERHLWAVGGSVRGERLVGHARLLAKLAIAVTVVAVVVLLVITQWDGLKNLVDVYAKPEFIRESWRSVLKGFKMNVTIFMITEAIVLVWALVVAVLRTLPGRWARPVRWLMAVYIDLLRGIPAILTILLVGLGLPNLKIPLTESWSDVQYAILALTLVYGAYVAEVYRAGIDSIHASQTMAARSLGLSYGQTMQHVVVPQAVRRIIPPLLNDFIGLQKDTALVSVIGALDALSRARFFNTSNATLTGYTVAAAMFVAITIPLARFTDWLIKRDQRRMRAG